MSRLLSSRSFERTHGYSLHCSADIRHAPAMSRWPGQAAAQHGSACGQHAVKLGECQASSRGQGFRDYCCTASWRSMGTGYGCLPARAQMSSGQPLHDHRRCTVAVHAWAGKTAVDLPDSKRSRQSCAASLGPEPAARVYSSSTCSSSYT